MSFGFPLNLGGQLAHKPPKTERLRKIPSRDAQPQFQAYAPVVKITSALFEAFLKCPTKYRLRSLGETGAGNEYADWVRSHGEAYERKAALRLQEAVPECERAAVRPAGKFSEQRRCRACN